MVPKFALIRQGPSLSRDIQGILHRAPSYGEGRRPTTTARPTLCGQHSVPVYYASTYQTLKDLYPHHDTSHCTGNLHVSRVPRSELGGHKGAGVVDNHTWSPSVSRAVGAHGGVPQLQHHHDATRYQSCLLPTSRKYGSKPEHERRPHQRRLRPSNEKEQDSTVRRWLLVPWASPNLPGSFGTFFLPEEAVSMAPKRKSAACFFNLCPPSSRGTPVRAFTPHKKHLVPCSLPSRSARALRVNMMEGGAQAGRPRTTSFTARQESHRTLSTPALTGAFAHHEHPNPSRRGEKQRGTPQCTSTFRAQAVCPIQSWLTEQSP